MRVVTFDYDTCKSLAREIEEVLYAGNLASMVFSSDKGTFTDVEIFCAGESFAGQVQLTDVDGMSIEEAASYVVQTFMNREGNKNEDQ